MRRARLITACVTTVVQSWVVRGVGKNPLVFNIHAVGGFEPSCRPTLYLYFLGSIADGWSRSVRFFNNLFGWREHARVSVVIMNGSFAAPRLCMFCVTLRLHDRTSL
jgi:hypothetical protein